MWLWYVILMWFVFLLVVILVVCVLGGCMFVRVVRDLISNESLFVG